VRARALAGVLAGFAAFGATACEPVEGSTMQGANLQDGVYCLVSDAALDVGTIRMRDNATLDCQGHRISDAAGRTSYAILARGDNIVLKHCVFDGFDVAVNFADVSNYRILDNVSVNSRFTGIGANGDHGLIARNIVHAPPSARTWTGIGASDATDIIGNTIVLGEYPPDEFTPSRTGISANYDTFGGVIAHNVVQVAALPDETGAGIYSRDPGPLVYRNVVAAQGGEARVGIECNGSTVIQNLVAGPEPDYASCAPYYETHVGLSRHARR
jgi:hypothetical protein